MITVIAIVIGIGIMILIHEFGHFVVAKMLGIFVEEFSIGFGPAIFKIQGKETLYKICPIPLGGYIKMKGEDPDSELSGSKDEFLSRKTYEKILVAIAGPAFNIVLAIIILPFAFSVFGQKVLVLPNYVQIVKITKNSPAEKMGLKKGDIIEKIDGEKINLVDKAMMMIAASNGNTLALSIKRNTENFVIKVKPEKKTEYDIDHYILGVTFKIDPIVGRLPKKSQAYLSGLRENDKILAVNGVEIISYEEIFPEQNDGKVLELKVKRGEKIFDVNLGSVKESNITKKGKIRKKFTYDIVPKYNIERLSFIDGMGETFRDIGRDFFMIYFSLKLIAKNPKQAKNLGGPIAIGYIIAKSLKEGFSSYIRWIAMISVNLAVVNLLPLIVTDGGLILIFLFEEITRRKMKKKEREVFATIGWGLLFIIFAFVMFNDISRYF